VRRLQHMSFNEGANLDTSQVTGGGSRGGLAIGGGIGGLVIVLIGAFLGVDLSSITGSSSPFDTSQVQPGGEASTQSFEQCKTGADANRDDTCRVIGTVNSVQDYWNDALPADVSRQYRAAKTVLYSGATQSPCGTASNQTGPFYCPSDERVYIDASFFDELTSRFGADDGALAQEYVVAHEYGHHVENILGFLEKGQDGKTGPLSGGVRIELMADCFAGVWAKHASTTEDSEGNTLLQPLTQDDIDSALSAAAAVGDDHIQESLGGGNVNQDTWTHGSSESRQKWFMAGYEGGTANSCDTFSTDDL
jgi:predicted metalloprotease